MLWTKPIVAILCLIHRAPHCFPVWFPRVDPIGASYIENVDVPLCIDCVHFNMTEYGRADLGRCSLYGKRNPVTGTITNTFAEVVRENDTECGAEGVHFMDKRM